MFVCSSSVSIAVVDDIELLPISVGWGQKWCERVRHSPDRFLLPFRIGWSQEITTTATLHWNDADTMSGIS